MKARKPEVLADEGHTLAAHLRRARKALGLKQIEVAALMGVDEHSVVNWERGRQPFIAMYPTILRFLGYEPWPVPQTLAEMLLAQRRREGRSGKETAEMMGIDQGTYYRMEEGHVPGHHHIRDIIERFLPDAPLPPLSPEALRYRRRRQREQQKANVAITC